jgi:hypothetical protein
MQAVAIDDAGVANYAFPQITGPFFLVLYGWLGIILELEVIFAFGDAEFGHPES